MTEEEWGERRRKVALRFYRMLAHELDDQSGKGRFFDVKDTFGWYLFQAEAFTDHPWNYDQMSGSRVVPIFKTIGRNLDRLLTAEGVEERARRIVTRERSQPNGGLFELLVAAAYRSDEARVTFRHSGSFRYSVEM